MLINTKREKQQKTPYYFKSFVIMSAKKSQFNIIFTLEQSKSMHIPQEELTRKKNVCM